MTAKEKAQSLLVKFKGVENTSIVLMTDQGVKQCALICVDEILKECKRAGTLDYRMPFWEEVKQEIEKL